MDSRRAAELKTWRDEKKTREFLASMDAQEAQKRWYAWDMAFPLELRRPLPDFIKQQVLRTNTMFLASVDPIPEWFAELRLTQEDVNKLQAGTEVVVIWAGGNGPALYTVRWNYILPVAVRRGVDVSHLTGVGAPPLTQVWLALDENRQKHDE